jgi:hypothetical protein
MPFSARALSFVGEVPTPRSNPVAGGWLQHADALAEAGGWAVARFQLQAFLKPRRLVLIQK